MDFLIFFLKINFYLSIEEEIVHYYFINFLN